MHLHFGFVFASRLSVYVCVYVTGEGTWNCISLFYFLLSSHSHIEQQFLFAKDAQIVKSEHFQSNLCLSIVLQCIWTLDCLENLRHKWIFKQLFQCHYIFRFFFSISLSFSHSLLLGSPLNGMYSLSDVPLKKRMHFHQVKEEDERIILKRKW